MGKPKPAAAVSLALCDDASSEAVSIDKLHVSASDTCLLGMLLGLTEHQLFACRLPHKWDR